MYDTHINPEKFHAFQELIESFIDNDEEIDVRSISEEMYAYLAGKLSADQYDKLMNDLEEIAEF